MWHPGPWRLEWPCFLSPRLLQQPPSGRCDALLSFGISSFPLSTPGPCMPAISHLDLALPVICQQSQWLLERTRIHSTGRVQVHRHPGAAGCPEPRGPGRPQIQSLTSPGAYPSEAYNSSSLPSLGLKLILSVLLGGPPLRVVLSSAEAVTFTYSHCPG